MSHQLPFTSYHLPITTHHLPITVYLLTFSCKTNPILSASGGFKTLYLTKAYGKNAKFSGAKANPNKPKQSQSDPHFSLVRGTQSQNEPKQTQSKANFKSKKTLLRLARTLAGAESQKRDCRATLAMTQRCFVFEFRGGACILRGLECN